MSQHAYGIKDMPLDWGSSEIEVSGVVLFDTKATPFFFDFIICGCSIERPTKQDLDAIEQKTIDTLNGCKDLISELKHEYA